MKYVYRYIVSLLPSFLSTHLHSLFNSMHYYLYNHYYNALKMGMTGNLSELSLGVGHSVLSRIAIFGHMYVYFIHMFTYWRSSEDFTDSTWKEIVALEDFTDSTWNEIVVLEFSRKHTMAVYTWLYTIDSEMVVNEEENCSRFKGKN